MTSATGRFIWHDLMTTDTKAAEAFYTVVTGWTATDSGMPGAPYTILAAGEDAIGGIMAIPQGDAGMPPCWTGYVGVPDVDAYTDRIAKSGGKVWKAPRDIPGVGRFSVVADPQGAVFILFKGTSEFAPASRPMGAAGHFAWNELHAGDGEKAFDWYQYMFGWEKAEAHDMGGFTYTTFRTGDDAAVGGMMTKMAFEPAPYWAYYVWVADFDAAGERVKAHGGKVLMDAHEVPGGAWILACQDPQGAYFNLLGQR